MSTIVLVKLTAIFAVIGLGWTAGRTGLLDRSAVPPLTTAAFVLFTPALLFRTTAGIAVADLPWAVIGAYFIPALFVLCAGYAGQRLRRPQAPVAAVTRGLSMSFSNTVQLGIPVVAALFGAAGLTVQVAIVSLQSLVLLTTATILAETELARARGRADGADGREPVGRVVASTVRRSLVHPVVLPILLGLAYNATGRPIPGPVDDILILLGQAVVPVSLITIGLTLQTYGTTGALRSAAAPAVGKLVVMPALVLAVAYWVFGLRGLPLAVVVLCAALPSGVNVLLFAGRYQTQRTETTAAIVVSTGAFVVSGPLWLLLLSLLGPIGSP